MERDRSKARPGGRTARTKNRTFEAVAALVAEKGPGAVSMAEIAERAGVAVTSLYRRWGDVRALIMDVAVDQLMRERPLPDTGTLSGDLLTWTRSVASGLRSPEGWTFFHALVATMAPGESSPMRSIALEKRLAEFSQLLDRARARGERVPPIEDVLDHLLAPLYLRALGGIPADEAFAESLVHRLLSSYSIHLP